MSLRAVIVDRSVLAVNMYRLLLKPWGTLFLVARKYEEARPWFFRREKIDLAVFNSNTFGKKFEEYLNHFQNDEPLAKVPKLFLCRDVEADFKNSLERLPAASVLERPFHPDDFLNLVRKMAGREKL